jgi:NAD(P)H-hydrate repair Nnr-like enzyme with NAD(P)H-hydrate dehydratase domain
MNPIYVDQKKYQNATDLLTKTHTKGIQGHALIIAGSYGKIGAAVLASKGCLKTGCGLALLLFLNVVTLL